MKIQYTVCSLLLATVLSSGLLPAASVVKVAAAELKTAEIPVSDKIQANVDLGNADARVDAVIEKIMADKQIPGISLAIVQDGKLIKTKGYGLIDRELNVRTRPSSVFPIASMSKPLTATGIMLLVQDGKIDLDAPISTYLQATPSAWGEITVRHLLTHTAGLSESIYSGNPSKLATSDGFLKQAAKAPLDFQPGESWMYSNTGYGLAAIVIEKVSGQPFAAFMKSRIFEPLGMGHTDALRASYVFSNRAMGYTSSNGGRSVAPIDFSFKLLPRVMPSLFGAGSVTSTVLDIAQWEIAMQKGKLLEAAVQAEMQQPVVMNSGLTFHYGLGWVLGQANGHSMVSHGGNLYGYSTSISRFPEDNLTVIVLTNKDDQQADEVAKKIAEQYVPTLATDWDAPAIADPNPMLTSQLLSYINGNEAAIRQTSEWKILLTTPRGQSIQAHFERDVRPGKVQALELISQETHSNGQRYQYRAMMSDHNRLINTVITPEGMIAAIGAVSE